MERFTDESSGSENVGQMMKKIQVDNEGIEQITCHYLLILSRFQKRCCRVIGHVILVNDIF